MTSDFPKIWTPEEIAKVTQSRVEDVLVEINNGRLLAVRIGAEYRVADAAVRAFLLGEHQPSKRLPTSTAPSGHMANSAQWNPRGKFSYKWPDGKTVETYQQAFETDVGVQSGSRHFIIGYTKRHGAGLLRQRNIVFMGQVPQIVPLVEFVGTNDFARTKHVASVVKDRSGKHVRSSSQLPVEYQGMPTVVYADVVVGPHAARSIGVLADNDDRDLMLRHAIIRATYKGMI